MVVQYRVIGLIPMAVGLSQSLAQRSGTVSQISSGTVSQQWLFQIFAEHVSVCAIPMHAAHSRLITYALYKSTPIWSALEKHLLTYLLTTTYSPNIFLYFIVSCWLKFVEHLLPNEHTYMQSVNQLRKKCIVVTVKQIISWSAKSEEWTLVQKSSCVKDV